MKLLQKFIVFALVLSFFTGCVRSSYSYDTTSAGGPYYVEERPYCESSDNNEPYFNYFHDHPYYNHPSPYREVW